MARTSSVRAFARYGLWLLLVLLVPSTSAAQRWPSKKNLKNAAQQVQSAAQQQVRNVKKTLAELERVGLEAPPAFVRPRQRRSVAELLAPVKRVHRVTLSAAESRAAADRAKSYAAREATAPSPVLLTLEKLRSRIAARRLSFRVGVTSVSGKPLNEITGLVPSPGWRPTRDSSTPQFDTPSMLRETLIQRATPPPSAPRPASSRRDVDDMPVAAVGNDLIVTPAKVAGTGGAWFPSSSLPSATNPKFSWRDKMTPVKSQAFCGSCWAFATLAVHEASEFLLNGRTVDLSEQQLVNCVPRLNRKKTNCEGNSLDAAFNWLRTTGTATEAAVPYQSAAARCDAAKGEKQYKVQAHSFAGRDDPASIHELKLAIVEHGPLVAGVHATDLFQAYAGGVFDEGASGPLNHAVVIVGWDDARQAWHVRNSWGPEWGEEGYMWIKFGSNGIGSISIWGQAQQLPKPEKALFSDRYLSVRNDSTETLRVFIQAHVQSGSAWKWMPAKPSSRTSWSFNLGSQQTLDVKPPGSSKYLSAKAARVWATSLDGKRTWPEFQLKDLTLVSKPYRAVVRERFTSTFAKPQVPLPTPQGVLTEAHELKDANKLADARTKYLQFIELFPEDTRVHDVRFWIGWTFSREERHWDAVQAFYDMIVAAPGNHPYLAYSFHYSGHSYTALGYCGYAVRNFEVVSRQAVPASPDWVEGSQTSINTLMNDNGAICSNWD
jgi:hypothetical protein